LDLNTFSLQINKSECDGQPICLSKKQRENLKKLLARALNKNQILILTEIRDNSLKSITSILTSLSKKSDVPLSTLKMNAKILRQLGLIEFNSCACLTEFGKFIIQTMGGEIPT
jgi:hypothetical protein